MISISNTIMKNRDIIECHLSLDFWGTLVFSNNNYREARANFLAVELNKSPILINNVFKSIGEQYNIYQESGLNNKYPLELFCEVLDNLNIETNKIDLNRLFETVLNIFVEYPPLINKELKLILDKNIYLGKTLSILSNTAFIPGNVINKFLDKNFGNEYFSFKLFSDELMIAKPNLEIYKIAFNEIQKIYPNGIRKSDILHIGDDIKNDYEAGKRFGINTYLLK